MIKVALVGNPNVGKTSVFNYITGAQFRVGNFPGVTVEKKSSFLEFGGLDFEIVDLPGIYSFIARSPDEKITREYLTSQTGDTPDLIINVVDANNLSRNLYLTTYLLQLGKPVIVALTMLDVALAAGAVIDPIALSKELSLPVVAIDSKRKKGKEELIKALESTVKEGATKNIAGTIFPTLINSKVEPLVKALQNEKSITAQNAFFIGFRMLEGDKDFLREFENNELVNHAKNSVLGDLKESFVNEIFLVLVQFRYNYIEKIVEKSTLSNINKKTVTQKIDGFLLNRFWGIPLFMLIIWFAFKVAISVGEAFQDFFDILFGGVFVDYLGHLLQPFPILKLVLANGIGAGLQAMATFVPIVFMVFVIMNLLEDSGYLARVSVLVDRIMRFLRLPGKALAPLIMGFGCNVTSILGSRILESPQERKITIAFSPFISCGARLPIYTIIAIALFPHSQGNIIFSLYFLGILVGIFTAFFLSRFVYKSSTYSFLLLELPSYQKPQASIVLRSALRRVTALIKRASLLVVIFTGLFQILDNINMPKKKEMEEPQKRESVMSYLGQKMTLPLAPMGITPNNWPAAVGLLNGLLAKEAVAGSMITSYATLNSKTVEKQTDIKISEKRALLNLWGSVKDAVMSVPHNLFGQFDEKGNWNGALFTTPGFYIPFYDFFNASYNSDTLVKDSNSVIPLIRKGFEDPSIKNEYKRKQAAYFAAYAFLIFILLYTGCIAVMSAIKKELGTKWMLGLFFYQLFLAYTVSTLFYQIALRFIL